MPIPKLFACPACGYSEYRRREYRPAAKPLYKGDEDQLPVHCSNCFAPMDQVLGGIGADVLPGDFVVDGETIGRGPGEVRFTSLRELRAFEQESEARFRNGEGNIYNFREFSQDRQNKLRNSFEGSRYQRSKSRLPEKRRTLSGLPIVVRPVGD